MLNQEALLANGGLSDTHPHVPLRGNGLSSFQKKKNKNKSATLRTYRDIKIIILKNSDRSDSLRREWTPAPTGSTRPSTRGAEGLCQLQFCEGYKMSSPAIIVALSLSLHLCPCWATAHLFLLCVVTVRFSFDGKAVAEQILVSPKPSGRLVASLRRSAFRTQAPKVNSRNERHFLYY
eukprot:gene3648-2583_t